MTKQNFKTKLWPVFSKSNSLANNIFSLFSVHFQINYKTICLPKLLMATHNTSGVL